MILSELPWYGGTAKDESLALANRLNNYFFVHVFAPVRPISVDKCTNQDAHFQIKRATYKHVCCFWSEREERKETVR